MAVVAPAACACGTLISLHAGAVELDQVGGLTKELLWIASQS
jgi:hypothetical protein